MFDDVMSKLFPPGADTVACVTETILWVLALLSMAGAIFVGLIQLLARSAARPAAVPLHGRVAVPPCRLPPPRRRGFVALGWGPCAPAPPRRGRGRDVSGG